MTLPDIADLAAATPHEAATTSHLTSCALQGRYCPAADPGSPRQCPTVSAAFCPACCAELAALAAHLPGVRAYRLQGSFNPQLNATNITACLPCPPGMNCIGAGLSFPTGYCPQVRPRQVDPYCLPLACGSATSRHRALCFAAGLVLPRQRVGGNTHGRHHWGTMPKRFVSSLQAALRGRLQPVDCY